VEVVEDDVVLMVLLVLVDLAVVVEMDTLVVET
jgi:hypothetical protein